jgi:hypothetical protein
MSIAFQAGAGRERSVCARGGCNAADIRMYRALSMPYLILQAIEQRAADRVTRSAAGVFR